MTKKLDIIKSIRAKCIDCCCGQLLEIRHCPITECHLWPYRMGSDPNPVQRKFSKKTIVQKHDFLLEGSK